MNFEELPKPIPIGNAENLSGKTSGTLTALYRTKKDNSHFTYWACHCTCGDYCLRDTANFKKGVCKCDNPQNHKKSLVGNIYGKLIVIKKNEYTDHNNGWKYLCLCSCGNEVVTYDKTL